ncbi:MAG: hypothetical protein O2798_02835 [Chloroflexi bacterium]|nr:hypothetical protein [Chloroflexota bacterium]MDA1239758.1 hypothetical protein [Chloroflexota bacterium]
MASDIPTLQTDRLLLRAFTADDLDAYAGMLANPGTGEIRTVPEAWAAPAASASGRSAATARSRSKNG